MSTGFALAKHIMLEKRAELIPTVPKREFVPKPEGSFRHLFLEERVFVSFYPEKHEPTEQSDINEPIQVNTKDIDINIWHHVETQWETEHILIKNTFIENFISNIATKLYNKLLRYSIKTNFLQNQRVTLPIDCDFLNPKEKPLYIIYSMDTLNNTETIHEWPTLPNMQTFYLRRQNYDCSFFHNLGHFINNYHSKSEAGEKFKTLAETWRKTRKPLSSKIREMIDNDAYREIIALGTDAIPYILHDLSEGLGTQRGPDFWFDALEKISGKNPVTRDHRGKIRAMAEDWLDWGKENKYI